MSILSKKNISDLIYAHVLGISRKYWSCPSSTENKSLYSLGSKFESFRNWMVPQWPKFAKILFPRNQLWRMLWSLHFWISCLWGTHNSAGKNCTAFTMVSKAPCFRPEFFLILHISLILCLLHNSFSKNTKK